jgi:neutral amino acid transport system ATP-binding protein
VIADSTTESATLLAIRRVSKRFGGIAAVNDVSFDVAERSLTALIGPNGAGKSTLFNVVSGFERANRGDVIYDGRSIFRRSAHVIARRGVVRTFQLTKALAVMSVMDNMLLASTGNPGERLTGALLRPVWARSERTTRERARHLLDVFGLLEKADEYAGTLSGGQRKLLELARALMLQPRLLLLDEPLAGVNRTLGLKLLEHVEALRLEQGITILLVEHDMDVVMRHAETVVVMAEGRIIANGPPDMVRRDEAVVAAYLGSQETRR